MEIIVKQQRLPSMNEDVTVYRSPATQRWAFVELTPKPDDGHYDRYTVWLFQRKMDPKGKYGCRYSGHRMQKGWGEFVPTKAVALKYAAAWIKRSSIPPLLAENGDMESYIKAGKGD